MKDIISLFPYLIQNFLINVVEINILIYSFLLLFLDLLFLPEWISLRKLAFLFKEIIYRILIGPLMGNNILSPLLGC